MIVLYMVILCLSALIGAWVGVRVTRRIGPMLGGLPGAGWCALIPATAFLIVVGAPAPVLVGALLLSGLLQFRAKKHDGVLVVAMLTLIVVLIGMTGLHPTDVSYLTTMPSLAALGVAGALWFCLAMSARFTSPSASTFAIAAMASLAVVAAAPIVVPTAHVLTLDAAIIASALAGILLAGSGSLAMGMAARMGQGFLIAYLQVAAIWQGAWIAAIASIAIWLAAVGYAWVQHDTWGAQRSA